MSQHRPFDKSENYKHVYDTTLSHYKTTLRNWYKQTGGGSGLITEFESWDSSKLEKDNIDIETYDHSDLSSRPPLLIHLYAKQKQPYITFIHIWDSKFKYILSSRYDPIDIGEGEP